MNLLNKLTLAASCILASMPVVAGEAQNRVVAAEPAYRTVTVSGFTRARAHLPLVAEHAGKVVEVLLNVGDPVGDEGVFARIDPTFIQLDLQTNQVLQKQLEDRIHFDRQEAERHRSLLDKGSASQSLYDQLQQTLRDNRHRLAELQVREEILQEQLQRTEIRALPGWLVTRRRVEPGQYVAHGATLGEVADYSTLLLPLALDPAQLMALRRHGDAIEVLLPDWQLQTTARIYRVNPGFDEQTRKINLELELHGDLPERRGGLRALLRLNLPQQGNAVTVPEEALEESYDEFWLTRENGVRVRVIKLGTVEARGARLVRVSGQDIRPGDRFRLPQE